MYEKITYGQLENGMKVSVQGHLMTVSNFSTHTTYDGVEVVRFTGHVDESDSLYNTGYNGGCYGGRVDLECTIVKREV